MTLIGLVGFKYLKRRRILTLALIITLSSMLFSMMALSLLGFYRGFNAYLGEGEDIIAIYDRNSRTPFTGLVPAYLSEAIGAVRGVLASSPEVIVPCIVKDESVFLRGVIPEKFSKLNLLVKIDGNILGLSDLDYTILGTRLAEKLKLKLGDKILVLGVLTDRYLELQVKGIYESHSAMDDEALVPLYVGQWLRGTDYDHITLTRLKIDRNMTSPAAISEELAREASEPSQSSAEWKPSGESILPTVRTSFSIEDVGVDEAQRFLTSYLDRYGVNRETLLILSVVVFLFSSTSVAAATRTIISQHRGEIEVLRSIGASKKTIERDFLVKLSSWSLISSAAGMIMATTILATIEKCGYLQVLSHTVSFQLDPLIPIVNIVLVFLLVSASIMSSDL